MKTQKKLLITVCIVLTVALVSGVSIWAATTFGTQTDPLVTLSYLNNKAKGEMVSSVAASVRGDIAADVDDKIDDMQADLERKIGSSALAASDVFSVVTLERGEVVKCAVGTEMMLRVGTADSYGAESPALIDTTSGTSLNSGSTISVNHMYMVTIEGNGIRATADSVKVLIRGDYTIG